MARALAEAGTDGVYSYAGRTEAPVTQPLAQRIGGFGGVAGLVDYLKAERITHLVDATHPFAAQMSKNAMEAHDITGIPLMALERPAWRPGIGDNWVSVGSGVEAAAALPVAPARVFLAIGRQGLGDFAAAPQHHYLLRLVDAPTEALPLPQTRLVLGRGPFRYEDDLALMRQHGTQIVVAKNAGGEGARAKLVAARELGLKVVMIDRPDLPHRPVSASVQGVLDWRHGTDRGE